MKNKFKLRIPAINFKEKLLSEQQGFKSRRQSERDKTEDINDLVKHLIDEFHHKFQQNKNVQFRDRPLIVEFNTHNERKYDQDYIQAWLGEVCRNIVSTSFHYYLQEEMTFEQSKVYCCEQILRNIAMFAQKNEVNADFYKLIDKLMKEKIMPYLALRYPLNEVKNTSNLFNKMVKQINNVEALSNDFLFNSNINFQYRENGNYNDLIMKVLNKVISISEEKPNSTNSTIKENQVTNFKDFQQMMTQIFEKVIDDPRYYDLPRQNITLSKEDEIQNQNYRQKVQEYTDYEIGKKIPQNVESYSDSQIQNSFINIKSSAVLRIITKWCQQLWRKFDQNYFIDRTEGISMIKTKQINIVYEWIKLSLNEQLKKQKQKILQYMDNIQANLYEQEFIILQSEILSKEAPFLNKYERICGKFSHKVVKNLQNCIIIYLNRLIHGLMTVSKQLYNNSLNKLTTNWPYPPNLLSFSIGDLIRCRLVSKEHEIIRVFKQLQNISETNPQKFKIIRIKNRLKTGTNDILINVRFNNRLTGEIQLKIKETTAKSVFEKCSYKYSHFIYELWRSYFGSVSQMCSIWTNIDPRASLYKQLVKKQKLNISNHLDRESYCLKNNEPHLIDDNITNTSFICNECGRFYSHDNYILAHTACKRCTYCKCSLCLIKQKENNDLLDIIIQDQEIKGNVKHERCTQIPKLGIFIPIQTKLVEYYEFKTIELLKKTYIFRNINESNIQLYKQLKTQKQKSQFLSSNLVYEYMAEESEQSANFSLEKAFKSFILPLQIKNTYKYQKETLSLNSIANLKITKEEFVRHLLGNNYNKKSVKNIQISDHELKDISFISEDFCNLQFVNCNINKVQNLEHLFMFKKLQTLFCISNELQYFPSKLCFLPLKYLSIAMNKISSLPEQISNLRFLEVFRVNNNKLSNFGHQFYRLQNLKELYASNNTIKQIPDQIQSLKKLQIFQIAENILQIISPKLSELSELKFLNFNNNKIQNISIQFKKLKKLGYLTFNDNLIQQFPQCLDQASSIKKLSIERAKIQSIKLEESFSMVSLQELILSHNQISHIEGIHFLQNLTLLNLENNLIQDLPQTICKLTYLTALNLKDNKHLKSLPQSFDRMKLQFLNISSSNLSFIFPQIFNLKYLKSLILINNNIKQIPKSIKNLKSLRLFDISYNQIKTFPDEILELKKLKKFNLYQQFTIKTQKIDLKNILPLLLSIQNQEINLQRYNIEVLPKSLPYNGYTTKLNLNYNRIEIIPKTIYKLQTLKVINLKSNRIKSICDELFLCKMLIEIDLSCNLIEKIPYKIHQLKKLKLLDISNNKLQYLEESIEVLLKHGLELIIQENPFQEIPLWYYEYDYGIELYLKNNKLSSLPKLSKKNNYQIINLQNNRFQQIPEEIFSFSAIKQLKLDDNKIITIPENIYKLFNLQSLSLNNNLIEEFPESLGDLKNLKHIMIRNNPLKIIHQNCSRLSLSKLEISQSGLHSIFSNQCLKYIKTLSLSINGQNSESISEGVIAISNLSILQISQYNLKVIPDSIQQIKTLTFLKIINVPIYKLPEDMQFFQQIQHFSIVDSKIQFIPQSIEEWQSLRSLQISFAFISVIPASLCNLTQLLSLNLSKNELRNLPESYNKLKNLEELNLQQNIFNEIPVCISHLKNLCSLNVSNNLLQVIPNWLSMLSLGEQMLILNGNPLQEIECIEYVLQHGNDATILQVRIFLAKHIKK